MIVKSQGLSEYIYDIKKFFKDYTIMYLKYYQYAVVIHSIKNE